jgi:hypothetical protein
MEELVFLSFSTVTRLWCWTTEESGFDSLLGLEASLFYTEFKSVLGPTQSLTQWVSEALSAEIKQLGREADHSPPSRD